MDEPFWLLTLTKGEARDLLAGMGLAIVSLPPLVWLLCRWAGRT